MAYTRNPRRRVIRGSSSDELRRGGRRTSEELDIGGDDMPFVRLGSSAIGTVQDVVQRIGDAIIGGDFGGNARGEGAIDIQIERLDSLGAVDVTRVASGVDSVAFGRNSRASGVGSVAIGRTAFADGPYAVALGSGEARADGSFAIGGVVTAGGDYGIVLGGQATVTAQGGIAIGEISEATAAGAIAIGDNETAAGGTNAVAIGNEARAVGNYSVSVGAAAGHQTDAMGDFVASGARSVAIGRLAYAGDADEAVIAATSLKMQTSRTGWNPSVFTFESVITTADAAPVTGNVATFADVDRIGDGGVALSALATLASPTFTGVVTMVGLDVNADSVRIRTSQTPASAAATGVQGEVAWDSGYVYVCIATDTWKRAGLSTW